MMERWLDFIGSSRTTLGLNTKTDVAHGMKRAHRTVSTDGATLGDLPAHVLAHIARDQCAFYAVRLGHVSAALRAKVPHPVRRVDGPPGATELVTSDFWAHWNDERAEQHATEAKDDLAWRKCAVRGHVLCVQMAIHRGIDTRWKCLVPLMNAIARGHVPMVATLMHDALAHDPIDPSTTHAGRTVGHTVLRRGIRCRRLGVIDFVLRTDAVLGDVTDLAAMACDFGLADVVCRLLDGPAERMQVDIVSNHHVLQTACANGSEVLVRKLLDAGAGRCACVPFGPLYCASANGHLAIVELLLTEPHLARDRRILHNALEGAQEERHAAIADLLKEHLVLLGVWR